MKLTDYARLLICRNGEKQALIYGGDYEEACNRFDIWLEDLWEGWTLEIFDRHDNLIRSSETKEMLNA